MDLSVPSGPEVIVLDQIFFADVDSGSWTIKEKDAEGEWTSRDLVAEFMSKVKLRK